MGFENAFKKKEQPDEDSGRWLRCSAPDCPLPWSVTGENGNYCSGHAWTDHRDWDAVTRRNFAELNARHDRMVAKQIAPRERPLTQAEKTIIANNAREAMREVVERRKDPKGWAKRLQELEKSGEKLSTYQRMAWRTALHMHLKPFDEESANVTSV